MPFRKKICYLFILALWSFQLCGGEVNFIITADLHGNLANLARLAPQIRRYPQAVKVDLGDFAQGNFPEDWQNGLPVISAFNALGYDILVPGNHDLEFPESVMHDWQRHFRGRIMGAQWSLGDFRPYKAAVIIRDGFRIGVIALGETGLRKRSAHWPKLRYENEVTAIAEAMAELLRADCHAIILLSHISSGNYPFHSHILREYPEIDAVIGAHSHREMPGGIINRVLICQPGAYAGSAVLLTLHFSEDKNLRFITSRLLRPVETTDAEIMAILRQRDAAAAGTDGEILARMESVESFGRMAAESLRRAVGADAAVIGLYPENFRRELTLRQIYGMLPYGNRIAVVTVQGSVVRQLLRRNRSGVRYFVSGDFSGNEVKLALSDYLLISLPFLRGYSGRITGIFERQVIIGALKNGEYSENTP